MRRSEAALAKKLEEQQAVLDEAIGFVGKGYHDLSVCWKAPCCKVAAQGTKVKEPKAGLLQLSNKNQLDVLELFELFELLIYVADPVCRHTKLQRKTVKT